MSSTLFTSLKLGFFIFMQNKFSRIEMCVSLGSLQSIGFPKSLHNINLLAIYIHHLHTSISFFCAI